LAKLDALLAKYLDNTISGDFNNPRVMTESELQFWKIAGRTRDVARIT
jgi:hypothetical protein